MLDALTFSAMRCTSYQGSDRTQLLLASWSICFAKRQFLSTVLSSPGRKAARTPPGEGSSNSKAKPPAMQRHRISMVSSSQLPGPHVPAPHTMFLPPFNQEVKPAGDAALVPPPLHCHTMTAEGQRGHYISSPSQESTAMVMGTEHTIPDNIAESDEGSRIIHDELRCLDQHHHGS